MHAVVTKLLNVETAVGLIGLSEQLAPDAVQLYSIGHSDHSIPAFVDLLHRHDIAVLVDVRSQPYSQWAPQFNRENLARDLQAAGMRYVFMGDALGGRPSAREFYDVDPEHPNYQRLAQSTAFQSGCESLLALARVQRAVIMCSEGDHLKCHRALLITPALLKRGARVFHIRPDGTDVEAQPEFQQPSLF